MTKTLWELPFASSWGGRVKLFELPRRNLALFFQGEDVDDRIVFEQVEAYKCTFLFGRTDDMSVAYDKIVDLGETSWLTQVRNRMREYGEALSPPSGPPDQLMHLMINLDDGPCYEFLCQNFHYDQVPTDPERWKMS